MMIGFMAGNRNATRHGIEACQTPPLRVQLFHEGFAHSPASSRQPADLRPRPSRSSRTSWTARSIPSRPPASSHSWRLRKPTVEELPGAATVIHRHVVAIDAPENVIDTCGTGGTGSLFFNISTTVALIAAAAGVPSPSTATAPSPRRSGSSDVLRVLGVNIETTPAQEARCLRGGQHLLRLPHAIIPAMRHVAPIRQALGFATIFNLLGPLTNPAGTRRQVVGTRSPALADKMLDVLVRLGAGRHRSPGGDPRIGAMCDISITGPTHMADYDGILDDTFAAQAVRRRRQRGG